MRLDESVCSTYALTPQENRGASDLRMMRTGDRPRFPSASLQRFGKTWSVAHKTRRRPDRSGAALSVRPGGQEVARPYSINAYAFMNSERALSASALLIPLVLALHSAILLFALAGLALRHSFT